MLVGAFPRKGQWAYKVCCFVFLFQYLSNIPPHPNSAACCGQSPQLPTPPIHPATMANTTRRVFPLLVAIFERDGEGETPLVAFSYVSNTTRRVSPLLIAFPFVSDVTGRETHVFFPFGRDRRGKPPSSRFLVFRTRRGGVPPHGEGNLPLSCFLSFWTRWKGETPLIAFSCVSNTTRRGSSLLVAFSFVSDATGRENFLPPCRIFFCFGRDGEGESLPRHIFRCVLLCFKHDKEGRTPSRRIFFCFGCDREGESLPHRVFHFEHDKERFSLVAFYVSNMTRRENPSSLHFLLFRTLRGGAIPSSSHFSF